MPKILIVDDDDLIIRVYRSKFLAEGFDVAVASTGPDALKQVDSAKPDVVLLDLNLPGIAGIEIIRSLRFSPTRKSLPVVVFSNAYLPEEMAAARSAGADQVICKGKSNPPDVVKAVRRVLATDVSATESFRKSPVQRQVESELTMHRKQMADYAKIALPEMKLMLGTPPALNAGNMTNLPTHLHTFCRRAGAAELSAVSNLASALEAMIRTLRDRPQKVTASAGRTTLQALSRLEDLIFPLPRPTRPLGNLRALVLDDEEIASRLEESALRQVGIASDRFTTVDEALSAARAKQYELVISDVMMGAKSGFKFGAEVRLMEGFERMPIVYVTAIEDFENKYRTIANAMDDYLGKPFLPLELAVKALVHLFRRQE
jgi:DNA-binding response OmpR family regulator